MSGNAGAECVITQAVCALREAFTDASTNPPLGGGSNTVRFFAGEAVPTSYVDLHINTSDCSGDNCCQRDPFLWVRLIRRYRSKTFPEPYVGPDACAAQEVIAVEFGVARCAVLTADSTADWTALAQEAEVSLDDSYRIGLAMCRASALMRKGCSDMQAQDVILPTGPDGGLLSWTGVLYARLDT